MGRPKGSKNKNPSSRKGKTYAEIYGPEKGEIVRGKLSERIPTLFRKGVPVSQEIKDTWKRNKRIGGLRKGAGRGKHGYYKGIWCDSSWELAFVVYCFDQGIDIKRNKESFLYFYEGATHKYFPDFLVDNSLVEIKGFVSSQAKEKILQCPVPVRLITGNEMGVYLDHAKNKCGCEDFTVLYEKHPAVAQPG